ncbi:carboxymuconolactone decarboxylase family protein [Frateuria aurantia]
MAYPDPRSENAHLTAAQEAILPVAAFAAAGELGALESAIEQALDADVAISVLREVLVQLYAYAGFPRSLNALGVLLGLVQQRQADGRSDKAGRDPLHPIPSGDALRAAGTANQTRLVGLPVQSPVFEFAPAIAEYLQTHLFGAIFERDNLDWQSRELATIGMLAALPGTEPQLQAHWGIARNTGLDEAQLQRAAEVLEARTGTGNGERAWATLARALSTWLPSEAARQLPG